MKFNDILVVNDDEYIIEKRKCTTTSERSESEAKPYKKQTDTEAISLQNDNIIHEVEEEAKRIVARAKQEATSIKEDAYDEGYSDGVSEGYKQGYNEATEKVEQQLNVELKKIDQLRQDMYKEKVSILKQCEKEMVELSIEIAKKILHVELEDDNTYLEFIRGIMANIVGEKTIQMRVNKEDFERILKNKDYLISSIEGLEDIEIIKDRYLTKGSCIIDGGIGTIDGSIDTQIKQIEEAFNTIVGNDEFNNGGKYV